MLNALPKSKDILENPMGFPISFELPIIKDLTKYKNTLYAPAHVTTNWEGYKTHLASVLPSFHPKVLLMAHDMSEIENITLTKYKVQLWPNIAHTNDPKLKYK